MGDISKYSSFSPIIDSRGTSPFSVDEGDFLHDVESRPASPILSASAAVTSSAGSSGVSISAINASIDPQAQLKFNIRARSIEVAAAHQEAIAEQTRDRAAFQMKESAWNATPVYHFSQRAKLYNASVKAQIRFNKSTSLIRLQQTHVDYIDALSKSSLSLDEQHAKYNEFKKAFETACRDRRIAGSSDELSIGCSSEFVSRYASKYAANKKAAAQSEKLVQKLLQDIQKPHTELRNNLAANLQYRAVQLHHTSDKNSPKAQQLIEEMKMIQSFQAAGGLDSLSSEEATKLNKIFKKASADYKQSTSPTPSSTALHQAEQDFKAADALVMDEIRKFGDLLKGPPQLRKELTVHLKHKEALKAAAGAASVPEIDEEIETLKRFLSSPQLASIKPEQASDLMDLRKKANQEYLAWLKLDAAAKTAEEAAKKPAPLPPPPKAGEKPPPTPAEQAIQARQATTAAKVAFEIADDAVIKRIRSLLYPPPTTTPPPLITQPTIIASPPQVVGLRGSPPLVAVNLPRSNAATTAVGVSISTNNPLGSSELQLLRKSLEDHLTFKKSVSNTATATSQQDITLLERGLTASFSEEQIKNLNKLLLSIENGKSAAAVQAADKALMDFLREALTPS